MTARVSSRRAQAALIHSADPLLAALIGAAVELAGFRAAFPQAGEELRGALMRVRPTHVLLDGADAMTHDGSVTGPALMTGARIFVYGTVRSADALQFIAKRYQARVILLPDDLSRLAEILTRRPSPVTERARAD